MRKAWVAFAAALTIGAAALTMSTPARAQCAAPVLAGGGCCGSYEPRGLFTSGGYGCGGYGYGGCGSCGCNGAGYSGTQPYYPEGYSHGRGYGYSGGGYYGRGYYGDGYYRPRVTAFGVERRHARRTYRRASRYY